MLDAQSGDTISFDSTHFPLKTPARIALASCLPELAQNHLTIDAGDAGVIIDGRAPHSDWCSGIRLTSSWNSIRGIRFEGFAPGAGVELSNGAQYNMIGGDPSVGTGPQGQGNVVGFSDVGIVLSGKEVSFNTIAGNFIGIGPEGDDLNQTSVGIWIEGGAAFNTIGPRNVIAYNTDGIAIVDSDSIGNTMTANSIYDNERTGISLQDSIDRPGGNRKLAPPCLVDFDLTDGFAAGVACPGCTVEIFSDDADQGRVFEGTALADDRGNFSYLKNDPFTGPHLSATATDIDGSTSGFSNPTYGTNAILQEGNDLSKSRLVRQPSSELQDNRLGQMDRLDEADFPTDYDVELFVNRSTDLGG
ncbi:MAG: hypothetical protein FJZ87_16130, partial [Chloroflexi bacterium]|nr:hypothetical protein [Chloroflexota bacterium]